MEPMSETSFKREIIGINLGGCGVRLGDKFLEFLTYDHGITPIGTFWESNPSQTSRLDVYFNSTKTHCKVRTFCADLDNSTQKIIYQSKCRQLYEPDYMKFGNDINLSGTGSNFGTGHNSKESKQLLKSLGTSMCEVAELTDKLQGFQIIHSIGGGTGSGFGSLLFEDIYDRYPKQLIGTFTVMPSLWLAQSPNESYNFMLSLPALKELTHFNICLDNESVCNSYVKECKIFKPLKSDVNHIMAQAITGVTTTFRFPTEMNKTLQRFYKNMVPKRDLHLLLTSISPFCSTERVPTVLRKIPDEATLSFEIFRSKNCLSEVDLLFSKILTMATVFRGPVNIGDINRILTSAKKQYSHNFSNWMIGKARCAISMVSTKDQSLSATSVINSSAVQQMFSRIEERYIYNRKRAFMLHYYTEQGVENSDFTSAHHIMLDWMDDYVNYSKDYQIKTISEICEKKKAPITKENQIPKETKKK